LIYTTILEIHSLSIITTRRRETCLQSFMRFINREIGCLKISLILRELGFSQNLLISTWNLSLNSFLIWKSLNFRLYLISVTITNIILFNIHVIHIDSVLLNRSIHNEPIIFINLNVLINDVILSDLWILQIYFISFNFSIWIKKDISLKLCIYIKIFILNKLGISIDLLILFDLGI